MWHDGSEGGQELKCDLTRPGDSKRCPRSSIWGASEEHRRGQQDAWTLGRHCDAIRRKLGAELIILPAAFTCNTQKPG